MRDTPAIMSGNLNDPAAAASVAGGSTPVQEVAVDLTKLNALSPEVISKQATVSYLFLHGTV